MEAWNIQDYLTPPPSLDGIDLVLVATVEACDFMRAHYPEDKPILIGDRILGAQNLDKFWGLENNTKVYAVGWPVILQKKKLRWVSVLLFKGKS
ncbi:MAG: hypothetical protein AB9917_11410 [Negativicutes bacterium]